MKRISLLSLAIAALVGNATASAADELQYGLRAGLSYSDNVERVSTNEESSGAAAVGFDVRALRETGRLRYNVFGDVEYRDYFESDVENQAFGRLIAESSYGIVPDTLEWMVSGSFDQVREDPLRPVAPDNLEDVITFSTGPRLTGRFGDAFEVQGEAHYTLADYSERPDDNETVGGSLALGRRISERSFIGVGASYDDVTYDRDFGLFSPDFERREYFVRFRTEGTRTSFDADVGYAEISGDNIDQDGPMARARLTRKLTPYLSGFLGYIREFPTSSDAAFTPQAVDGAVIGDASILTAGPRENESAQIGVLLNRPRTSATLMYARRTESTLTGTTIDRDVDDVTASVSRLITTRSTVSVYGTYSKDSIEGGGVALDGDSDEMRFGVRLNLVFGRAIGLDFVTQYTTRDSDVAGGDFDEVAAGIFLRYGTTRELGTVGMPTP